MADVQITVGSEGSTISDSDIVIGNGNVVGRDNAVGRDASPRRLEEIEIEKLRQRVKELEQFVFGDEKLGVVGIRQQLQGQRFWTLFNVALTGVLVVYEFIRLAS